MDRFTMIGTLDWSVSQEGPWSVPGLRTSSSLCLTKAYGSWVWIMQNQKSYGSRCGPASLIHGILTCTYMAVPEHGFLSQHFETMVGTAIQPSVTEHKSFMANASQTDLFWLNPQLHWLTFSSPRVTSRALDNRCSQSSHSDMDRIHDLLDTDLCETELQCRQLSSDIVTAWGHFSNLKIYIYICMDHLTKYEGLTANCYTPENFMSCVVNKHCGNSSSMYTYRFVYMYIYTRI